MDFVHPLEFQITRKNTFWKLNVFPFSVEGRETPTVLSPLERANLNLWITMINP
jgi:hypothetical protein